MSSMVNDLIGYTRTELGSGMPITLRTADMLVVCRAAIEDAHSSFPETRFELQHAGATSGPFDVVRLHQLLTNLLVNAAKFGIAGEPVRVRLEGRADSIRVEVNNRGPAIPKALWRKVFEPLVQIPGTSSGASMEDRASLGLGLYVAREIARLHSGTIEVESTAESGTTFTVDLPRAPDATTGTASAAQAASA